jgi:dTDP-4-dehydrorhamnose reductase
LKKLLVIGGTGLVGSKVLGLAHRHGYEADSTQNARASPRPNAYKLDITNREATLGLIKEIGPEAIVNTAALHNVDYCETHVEEATRVNVGGARNLADAATRTGARLVHLSTDYVFDGKRGHYSESDVPNPLHYYARTKLESEQVVSECSNYAIARPSVIYGWNRLESTGIPSSSGKTINFAMYVLDRLSKKETFRAIRDQYSSPTFADNLAEAVLLLAKHRGNGLFHTAGRTCASRYEFALNIAAVFGHPGGLVQPVLSAEFKQLAVRPKNSCLSVDRTEDALGMKFLTMDEGIREMKNQTVTNLAS